MIWLWALARQMPASAWIIIALLVAGGGYIGWQRIQIGYCHHQRDQARTGLEAEKGKTLALSAAQERLRESLTMQSRAIDEMTDRANRAQAAAAKAAEDARRARAAERGVLDRLKEAVATAVTVGKPAPGVACPGDASLDRVWEQFR